jgi:hypothetical protein
MKKPVAIQTRHPHTTVTLFPYLIETVHDKTSAALKDFITAVFTISDVNCYKALIRFLLLHKPFSILQRYGKRPLSSTADARLQIYTILSRTSVDSGWYANRLGGDVLETNFLHTIIIIARDTHR